MEDVKVTGSKDDVLSAGGWSFNYSKPRKGEDYRYNIRDIESRPTELSYGDTGKQDRLHV